MIQIISPYGPMWHITFSCHCCPNLWPSVLDWHKFIAICGCHVFIQTEVQAGCIQKKKLFWTWVWLNTMGKPTVVHSCTNYERYFV